LAGTQQAENADLVIVLKEMRAARQIEEAANVSILDALQKNMQALQRVREVDIEAILGEIRNLWCSDRLKEEVRLLKNKHHTVSMLEEGRSVKRIEEGSNAPILDALQKSRHDRAPALERAYTPPRRSPEEVRELERDEDVSNATVLKTLQEIRQIDLDLMLGEIRELSLRCTSQGDPHIKRRHDELVPMLEYVEESAMDAVSDALQNANQGLESRRDFQVDATASILEEKEVSKASINRLPKIHTDDDIATVLGIVGPDFVSGRSRPLKPLNTEKDNLNRAIETLNAERKELSRLAKETASWRLSRNQIDDESGTPLRYSDSRYSDSRYLKRSATALASMY
jgi:hypothetical protein